MKLFRALTDEVLVWRGYLILVGLPHPDEVNLFWQCYLILAGLLHSGVVTSFWRGYLVNFPQQILSVL